MVLHCSERKTLTQRKTSTSFELHQFYPAYPLETLMWRAPFAEFAELEKCNFVLVQTFSHRLSWTPSHPLYLYHYIVGSILHANYHTIFPLAKF